MGASDVVLGEMHAYLLRLSEEFYPDDPKQQRAFLRGVPLAIYLGRMLEAGNALNEAADEVEKRFLTSGPEFARLMRDKGREKTAQLLEAIRKPGKIPEINSTH